MRVFNVETKSFEELLAGSGQPAKPFAILSHAVETSTQWTIQEASGAAIKNGVTRLWECSSCVDQNSTAQLETAVTECQSRLRSAHICLVYLHDLPALDACADEDAWRSCRYWTRAWTLAEFVVPERVEIFDCQWTHRGSKGSPELASLLSSIITIPRRVLEEPRVVSDIPAGLRISWGASRAGNRPEDAAYALMPVLGVSIPVCYGEGAENAFLRLQKAFIRQSPDASILLWKSSNLRAIDGFLAHSPSEFHQSSWVAEPKAPLPQSPLQTPNFEEDDTPTGSISQSNEATLKELSLRPKEEGLRGQLEDVQSQEPDLAQMKRKRAASMASVDGNRESWAEACDEHAPEDFDLEDDCSDSESESDCGCDCHCKSYLDDEMDTDSFELDAGHELLEVRDELAKSAFEAIKPILKAASYTAPPDDRLPPRKRLRTQGSICSEDEKTPAIRGFDHLACPFYRRDPVKYRACLLQHDLQSIEQVIAHISRYHREPPYCPICRREFGRALARDRHVRARTCTPATGDVDGVNEHQRRVLARRDKIQLGERRRWGRVWRTVFPRAKHPPGVYLDAGLGREISILRDYWASRGNKLVLEFLNNGKKAEDYEFREIHALSDLCLSDLIERLAEEHRHTDDSRA